MSAPDERLGGLIDAILDGTPIDWPSAEAQSSSAERQLLEELRVLEGVADLHRCPPAASPAEDVSKFERWGQLLVLEEIGHGFFGTVYRAWDTRLDREVALKLMPVRSVSGGGDPASVLNEGRLLARVRHPNVVTVYGAEEIENRIGLWMEFIRGSTLEQVLETGRTFSAADATEIGIQLCGALSAVHGAGLLHRDIKAQNVALENGRAVLMDFGAGRELADSVSSDLTGTPLYLAPEIFDRQQASVRSDVYSLGVLMHHLVTRSYPVPGRSLQELRQKHQRGERLPLREVRPDLPECFAQIVERATAPRPADRYDSAAAIGAALTATVAVPALPSPRRWPGAAWIGALAATVALAIGWAVFSRPSAQSGASRSEWTAITDFSDSATQPAISPDGTMVAFIRGSGWFHTAGQIYVKPLPDGAPRQLTDNALDKMKPVFSPDGSQIAYTTVDRRTFRWDTQIVGVHSKEPPRLLANASGLTWVDGRTLLFSEIKAGIHMALVTATEDRDASRDLYVPSHERGMVHSSALSPDGRWVLAAEMENQLWLPCRLLPFDARDRGRPIGPPGAPCIGAAWSPDGAWMYVNVSTGGSFHIWRQRFPDGAPEQVTFGPTEETGLALAPDGRSLVTSVGITASSVWIHDGRGERQISSEGSGHLPGTGPLEARPRGSYFSPGDNRLYYLTQTAGGSSFLDGQLWAADLSTGRSEQVLPDFTVASFDVSDDGARVVFAAPDAAGKPYVWLAWLDRRSPPRRISAADHDHPMFLPNGEIIVRASEGGANFVYRMNEDGTNRRKVVQTPILGLQAVSPDGGWVVAFAPISGDADVGLSVFALPTGGGPAVRVCDTCKASWSRDGRRLYVSGHEHRTHVVALDEPGSLPDLPAGGLRAEADFEKLPVIQVIDQPFVAPGRDAGVYAFSKVAIQRNLYRVPLP